MPTALQATLNYLVLPAEITGFERDYVRKINRIGMSRSRPTRPY